jgi:hypothetical protein
MTPEERDLVAELFDRLATLENAPRDPDAERAIRDGLKRAPSAIYALVQTVLVQDEALKRADAHIQELEAALNPPSEPSRSGGFLDNMRGALFGRKEDGPRPGSVPSVPPRQADAPMGAPPGYGSSGPGVWGAGSPANYGSGSGPAPMEPGRPGGSFLGTMAASAAGVIGGSMLLDSIRSMMGHRQGFGSDPANAGTHAATSPWSDSGSGGGGGGNLARDAGLDDIGRNTARQQDGSNFDRNQGLFDGTPEDVDNNDSDNDGDYEDDDNGFGNDSDDA